MTPEDHAKVLEKLVDHPAIEVGSEQQIAEALKLGAAALRQQAQPWQKIETAPNCGVLVLEADGGVSVARRLFGEWISGEFAINPTHWMKLPPPPPEAT